MVLKISEQGKAALGEWQQINETCLKAEQMTFNGDENAATVILSTHRDNASCILHSGENELLEALLTSAQSQQKNLHNSIDLFTKAREQAESEIEKLLASKKKVVPYKQLLICHNKLIIADSYLFTGLLQLQSNSYVSCAWSIKKAWSYYKEVAKKIEIPLFKTDRSDETIPRFENDENILKEIHDSTCFGLGTFIISASFFPKAVNSILFLVGIPSNRKQGLDLLFEAIKGGGVRSYFASVIITMFSVIHPRGFHTAEDSLKSIISVLRNLEQQCPNGLIPLVLLGMCERKVGNGIGSYQYSLKILNKCKEKEKEPPEVTKMEIALNLLIELRLDEALDAYSSVKSLGGRLGEISCLFFTRKYDRACALIDQTVNNLSEKDSQSLVTLVKTYSNRSLYSKILIPIELLYLRRDLAHIPPSSVRQLSALLANMREETDAKPLKKEEVALYSLLKGSMHKLVGENEKAYHFLTKCIRFEDNIKTLTHVIPSAYYELAELAFMVGNFTLAKSLLLKVLKWDGYSMENPVRNRVNVSLELLKEIKARSKPSKKKTKKLNKNKEAKTNKDTTEPEEKVENAQEKATNETVEKISEANAEALPEALPETAFAYPPDNPLGLEYKDDLVIIKKQKKIVKSKSVIEMNKEPCRKYNTTKPKRKDHKRKKEEDDEMNGKRKLEFSKSCDHIGEILTHGKSESEHHNKKDTNHLKTDKVSRK